MTETVQCDLRINGGKLLNTDTATLAQGDIAIKGDQVIAIENIPENYVAARTIDATGLVVTPGIIDLHTHVAGGLRRSSPYVEDMMQEADTAGVHSGVTTLVDAGSCGIANIGGLVNHVIPNAKTRVLALLNVGSLGVNRIPEVTSALDIEHDAAVATIQSRKDVIIGVKARMVSPGIAELGIDLPKAAKSISDEAGVRLMVHVGDTTGQSDQALNAAPEILGELLTENDIVTHSFSAARGGLIGADRTLLREALDARARGVKFDIGVGGKNFSFDAAKRVLDGGLMPDTISSDVTLQSRYVGTSFSQMDCIGKVISLGIGLEDALVMSTRKPAAILGPQTEQMLGCMAPGTHADLTILKIHEGEWQYIDGDGVLNIGPYALEPVSCIRAGQVMPIDYGPREGGWLPNRKQS
ncbi:MAG: amidohydrolase family protein [Chloroflexi bacterium]|nr:amidohydrolase family protein [Chloroflexota bacterium]MYK61508.1 amidohydrolase family protein [Chloroflexota bacterium]